MSPETIRAGRSLDAAMRRAEFRAHPLIKGDMFSTIAILQIVGLPLGALLLQAVAGPIEAHSPPSLSLLLAGGLLVGFGIRLGSGCPSGHGACEVPRLSRRSIRAEGLRASAPVRCPASLAAPARYALPADGAMVGGMALSYLAGCGPGASRDFDGGRPHRREAHAG